MFLESQGGKAANSLSFRDALWPVSQPSWTTGGGLGERLQGGRKNLEQRQVMLNARRFISFPRQPPDTTVIGCLQLIPHQTRDRAWPLIQTQSAVTLLLSIPKYLSSPFTSGAPASQRGGGGGEQT